MKYFTCAFFAIVSINAVAANTAPIPTLDPYVAEGQPNPKYLPINMMAQFYDVPEHQVSVEVVKQTPQTATVIASVPRGHRCTFELVRAPSGVNVPSGWLTAAPECVTRGAGGIPVIDGAALEQARKAAESQNAADGSDYDYWTDSGAKPAWMPTGIKSNGGKTYIQFSDAKLLAAPKQGETSKAPALFVMPTKPGDPDTVRYRVVGDQYEVDSVIEKAVLVGPGGSANNKVLILHKPASANGTN